MGRIFVVMLLGVALFFAGAWHLGYLENGGEVAPVTPATAEITVTPEAQLGGSLYEAQAFPAIAPSKHGGADRIVLSGVMNAIEIEEVPSQVPGRILFIGEQVDESLVLAAGSATFLAEPYYSATVYAGRQTFIKFYRRIYEGQTIKQGQVLALIEPGKALGDVLSKQAKIELAKAEKDAAIAGEEEGKDRYNRALILFQKTAIAKEDLGSAKLTWVKLNGEMLAKFQGVKIAEEEKNLADIDLQLHEIRATMPYKLSSIKTIVRQRGYSVKPGDPVIIVQNLDRLQAEALIEEQYYTYLRSMEKNRRITATIEPTILDKPISVLPGHYKDVTSVAVSRDMKIVSGSEDKTVCIWTRDDNEAPLKKLEHDDAVRVVACAPASADKNLCLAGCANGDIYLWDLDAKEDTPLKIIEKAQAHGENSSITSLAFSPDGKFFASGSSDGSIRLWNADGSERYAFTPQHGVKQSHEDAVTALTFTNQGRLISAGRDKSLRIWILKEKGAVADRKAIHYREGNVPQLGVSHDGKWMLFDQGRTLKLLSVESQTLKHTLTVPVNSTPFESLALFSPDDSLILTAGAPEGRLQLWQAPGSDSRGFEVRQFATSERLPVACAAFSPDAGKGGENSFAVSASGLKIYKWAIPTRAEVQDHRIKNVEMTLRTHSLDPSTRQSRVGFEVANPDGRFEAGRPVTIVIE